jgi:hypothetical protein
MRRLLTGYAVSFNRRHRRHGPLFQNRYKSILCQEDPYLLELVRYIHLNPLRAGIVKELKVLATYPYSGHCALMGKKEHALPGLRLRLVVGSSARFIRSCFQGDIYGRKATRNGTGTERVVLLGNARTGDERGRNIEETEHRLLDGKRIGDKGPANRRKTRVKAFRRGY